MKETRYHIIKEQHIDLDMLPSSLAILKAGKGFQGKTHRELRTFGSPYNGYTRTKNNKDYWVLPYFYVPQLDVTRKDESNNIISKTYTIEELNSFGWDVIEEEI